MFSPNVVRSVTKAFEQANECGYAHVGLELWLRVLLDDQEFLKIVNGFNVDVARLKGELNSRLVRGEKIEELASSSGLPSRPRSTLAFQSFMRGLASKNKSPVPDELTTRDRYLENGIPAQVPIEMTDVFHGFCFLKESVELRFAKLLSDFSRTKEAR